MKIKVLVENTCSADNFKCEHALSFWIESGGKIILFDMGETSMFASNAEKMGLDLSLVDMAVISHGHDDHGGGLGLFLEKNQKAKIYVHSKAFGNYYSLRTGEEPEFIGLVKELKENPRVVLCHDEARSTNGGSQSTASWIDLEEGGRLFSGITPVHPYPESNKKLYADSVPDLFYHEQNLVLEEDDKTFLIAGCAHNGILNILNEFRLEYGKDPDYAIGGLHLYKAGERSSGFLPKDPEIQKELAKSASPYVKEVGKGLLEYNTKFYTCHCTGFPAYFALREMMGDKIKYLSTGQEVRLDD